MIMTNAKGFTVIEIIAVLVLIGILSAVAVSRVGWTSANAYSDADRLVADLRYAQGIAMKQPVEEGVTVNINDGGNDGGWQIAGGFRFADGETARGLRRGVSLEGADVTFSYPRGNVSTGTQNIIVRQGGTTLNVIVYGGTGYVEIQ